RERKERGGERLLLKEPEEPRVGPFAPSAPQRLIARIFRPAEYAVPENVDAEARAPRAHHPGDGRPPRPGAVAGGGGKDGEAGDEKRPPRIHRARVAAAELPQPERRHRDCG